MKDAGVYGELDDERVTTNADGAFSLTRPTGFVHVFAAGFRPLSIIVLPGQMEIVATLEDEGASTLALPGCPMDEKGVKRAGMWFRFALPIKTKISKGSDTDYIIWRIRYPHSRYWMGIDSGPTLGGSYVNESVLKDSLSFSERWVDLPDKSSIGIDATGQHKDGMYWRSFGTSVDQASYYEASADAAKFFDQVISHTCISREFLNAGQQAH